MVHDPALHGKLCDPMTAINFVLDANYLQEPDVFVFLDHWRQGDFWKWPEYIEFVQKGE